MRLYSVVKFKPQKETLIAGIAFLAAVLANSTATLLKGTIFYYLFYHGIFVLGISILFPIWFTGIKRKRPLSYMGITNRAWLKAIFAGMIFAGALIPGRVIGHNITYPPAEVLLYTTISLVMASLFEEVFFRGFLQTTFENAFGIIPAIILSGITFSIYHIGYRDFRDIKGCLCYFLSELFLLYHSGQLKI